MLRKNYKDFLDHICTGGSRVDEMKLFEKALQGQPIDTSLDKPDADSIVWQNENYMARIIANPYVNGIHIVVDAKSFQGEEFSRQWMTRLKRDEDLTDKYTKMTLESTAIALGVRKLLGGGKGEVHNSGNWAGGLKSTEEGKTLDTNNLQENPKQEKRLHRPDVAGKNDFGTFMHVHVYIPKNGKVILPVTSKSEANEREGNVGGAEGDKYRKMIEKWEKIPKTTSERTNQVRNQLGNNLSRWVNENCAGKLIKADFIET